MPVISTNLAANSAVRYLNINSAAQTSSLSKLASGSRITQASDDAAGLAISTKISSDVTALTQAATNASHGISVLQTADGGASNISDILQRMKALASQSASGTVTNNERAYIDAEFKQLTEEVDAISVGTRYNGQSLLDGTSSFAKGISVMVGSDAADTITVTLDKLNAQGLKLSTSAAVANLGTAAITAVTGVTGVTAVTTGNLPLTGAALTAANAGGTFSITNTATGVTTNVTIGATADAATLVAAINAGGATAAGYTASIDAGNNLVLTSNTTNNASGNFTLAGADVAKFFGAAPAVTAGVTTVVAVTGAAATAPANVVLDVSTPLDASAGDISFDVNGATVTLTAAGGTAGVYDAAAVATAINAALTTAGLGTLSANAAGTNVTLANTATGAAAELRVGNFEGVAPAALGLTTNVPAVAQSVATQAGAKTALTALDAAINTVSAARANIGSLESRFGFHQASIATSVENLTAAVSAIKDTDVASEAAKLASSKVKTQAAVAAAAQASQMPQDLLKLLQ